MRIMSLLLIICSISNWIFAQELADPDPNRLTEYLTAFAQQDQNEPFYNGGIVFVGSSSVGKLNITRYFPGIVALNRGLDGAHISDLNHYLEETILQYAPETVVFYCGGNDLWEGKSPTQAITDFAEFTARLFARLPETKLIVLALRPSPSRISIIDQELEFNALLEVASEQDERITYLDGSASRFLDADGQLITELYLDNQYHMSHDGYLIWGEIIRPHLKPLFLAGGDISTLTKIEQLGGIFRVNNEPNDCITILSNQGWNCFRVRLFVKPNMENAVVQDLPYVLALSKRIKAAGAQLLLDFHYSDTWADPGKQFKPAAWKYLDYDALVQQVHDYTAETIATFKAEGVLPEIVQIGNEITGGFLWPEGKLYFPNDPVQHWEEFTTLLKAAIAGAKQPLDVNDPMRIMLHIDGGGRQHQTRHFFNHILAHGVEFDIIGQSYYPWWHGTMDDVRHNLEETALTYQKDIMIVETAYPWRSEPWWQKRSNMAWPITREGQATFLAELTEAVLQTPENRGLGVIYWYPEAIRVRGMNVWNDGTTAVFDNKGNIMPSSLAIVP